jgi:hypothetical protein
MRALVVTASVLVLLGCSGVRAKPAPVPADTGYPAAGIATFLGACGEVADGDLEFCGCLLKSVQGRYTYAQYQAIDAKLRQGGQDPAFEAHAAAASEKCRLRNHTYPHASHIAFLLNCVQKGAAPQVCKCMLTEVETRYDFEHFTEIDRVIGAGGKDEAFAAFMPEAVGRCTHVELPEVDAARMQTQDACRKVESEAVCECVIQRLDQHYSQTELAALHRRSRTAWPDPEFTRFATDVAVECKAPQHPVPPAGP